MSLIPKQARCHGNRSREVFLKDLVNIYSAYSSVQEIRLKEMAFGCS